MYKHKKRSMVIKSTTDAHDLNPVHYYMKTAVEDN